MKPVILISRNVASVGPGTLKCVLGLFKQRIGGREYGFIRNPDSGTHILRDGIRIYRISTAPEASGWFKYLCNKSASDCSTTLGWSSQAVIVIIQMFFNPDAFNDQHRID